MIYNWLISLGIIINSTFLLNEIQIINSIKSNFAITQNEKELIAKTDSRNQGKYLVTTSRLIYKDGKGKIEKERKLKTWRLWNNNNNEMLLIKFMEPNDIKNSAFLSVKKEGKSTQKLYLPSFQKVRLIAESSKNASFMGSDFNYSDLEPYDLAPNKNKLLNENGSFYEMEGILPEEELNRRVYKINKTSYVIESTQFYKKDCKYPSKEMKTMKVLNEKGIYISTHVIMTTFKDCSVEIKSSSESIVDEYKFLSSMDEQLFSERTLSKEEF